MGRSKKYQKYTAEQLTELATLTTRKQLRRFARVSKHSYQSVYIYWRKTTGKKLTDFDPKAKGAPAKRRYTRRNTNNSVVSTTNIFVGEQSISLPIRSLQIVSNDDGTQRLVINY